MRGRGDVGSSGSERISKKTGWKEVEKDEVMSTLNKINNEKSLQQNTF